MSAAVGPGSSKLSQDASQRRIARIFWSSPFGGLEEERELLTKKYWPQLAHMCQKSGYEYVPVDMRWGITSDHSTQALTIEICLRELDRSHMIVGFFGQRYGWHGQTDAMLQKTFDYASASYPFINEYRDRSVTELEFLHGHLNKPGGRPASFFFRDKAYDDGKLKEYEEAGDERNARKFLPTSDGPNASEFLADLKQRVITTQNECLAVEPCYSTPSEGAKLMFETVQSFLETFLKPAKAVSQAESDRQEHHAFLLQKLGMGGSYVGGENHLKDVNRHLFASEGNDQRKHLLVVGEPGSGKTCLLGNWLIQHQEAHGADIVAYHMVGCSSSSTSVTNVLQRLCNEIEDALFNLDNIPLNQRKYSAKGREAVRDLQQILRSVVSKATKRMLRVVIVIDALNMMEKMGKTMKTLYWLPKSFQDSTHVILSTTSTDVDAVQELVEQRGFARLDMVPLTEPLQSEIIQKMLIVRGKELSSKQHDRVIACKQTENPLFLMILLQELCSFGSFFGLDDFIDSLLAANSVTELFIKFLKRLEKDYSPADRPDLVKKVMCSVLVARHGLSESEMKTILGLSDQAWSTLYFAMNDFVVERSGLYVFAYSELAEGVRQHFCSNNDAETEPRNCITDYFLRQFQDLSSRYDTKVPDRVINELPWLLCKLDAKDRLEECLLNLALFTALFRDQHKYDLVDYWKSTGLPGKEIQQLYMRALDEQVALLYTDSIEETGTPPMPSPANQLVPLVASIGQFLEEAGHRTVLEPLLLRAIRMHPELKDCEVLTAKHEEALSYFKHHNQLACFYADIGRFDEAYAIHNRLLALKEKLDHQVWMSEKAVTLNNIGFVELKVGHPEKALEYFQQALALHKEKAEGDNDDTIASSINNIGSMLCILGRYEEAAKTLQRSLQIYEEIYFDSLPPDVGGVLLNLAKCHVRNPDKTQEDVQATYQRAIDISEKAYGRDHPEVAKVLTTYGAYMQRLQKTDQALSMYLEALDIYQVAYGAEGLDTIMVQENIALAYVIKEQFDKAIPFFNQAGEALYKQGLMDQSLESLNTAVLRHHVGQGQMEEAHRVLERVITAKFATEDMFVTLDQLDERLLGNQRPERPFEHTLDYALTKFPSSMRVLGRKLVLLARDGDADTLLDLISKNPDGKDPGLYTYAYSTFVNNNHREEGQKLMLAAAELFPDDLVILENLAKCHGFYQRYAEGIEVIQRALCISPENIDLLIVEANLLARNGQLQECKQKLNTALRVATDNDDQPNVDKVSAILNDITKVIASQDAS